jgi:hypothetical protein
MRYCRNTTSSLRQLRRAMLGTERNVRAPVSHHKPQLYSSQFSHVCLFVYHHFSFFIDSFSSLHNYILSSTFGATQVTQLQMNLRHYRHHNLLFQALSPTISLGLDKDNILLSQRRNLSISFYIQFFSIVFHFSDSSYVRHRDNAHIHLPRTLSLPTARSSA